MERGPERLDRRCVELSSDAAHVAGVGLSAHDCHRLGKPSLRGRDEIAHRCACVGGAERGRRRAADLGRRVVEETDEHRARAGGVHFRETARHGAADGGASMRCELAESTSRVGAMDGRDRAHGRVEQPWWQALANALEERADRGAVGAPAEHAD